MTGMAALDHCSEYKSVVIANNGPSLDCGSLI
jgi:hypothetical protein